MGPDAVTSGGEGVRLKLLLDSFIRLVTATRNGRPIVPRAFRSD